MPSNAERQKAYRAKRKLTTVAELPPPQPPQTDLLRIAELEAKLYQRDQIIAVLERQLAEARGLIAESMETLAKRSASARPSLPMPGKRVPPRVSIAGMGLTEFDPKAKRIT